MDYLYVWSRPALHHSCLWHDPSHFLGQRHPSFAHWRRCCPASGPGRMTSCCQRPAPRCSCRPTSTTCCARWACAGCSWPAASRTSASRAPSGGLRKQAWSDARLAAAHGLFRHLLLASECHKAATSPQVSALYISCVWPRARMCAGLKAALTHSI